MQREEELRIASALNEAIYLRDNVEQMGKDEVIAGVRRLATYGVFSNRQIGAIINGRMGLPAIGEITMKSDKSGGNLNPGSLDLLLSVLYNRAVLKSEIELIAQAVDQGTSHHMISKLTGIDRSSISKKVRDHLKNVEK
jgi:hypothetical protein